MRRLPPAAATDILGLHIPVSASATVTNTNGHLSSETSSAQELSNVEDLDDKLRAIDSEYPPSEPDPRAKLYRVTDVRPDGIAILDGDFKLKTRRYPMLGSGTV
jgi:hypothetical protein